MARAGYDVHAIRQFFRRIERFSSGEKSPEMGVTHPTTAERLAAFEMTLKEIEEKLGRGESLRPMPEAAQ